MDTTDSSLYRRVWRWHFYAGLVCLPFLVLLAVTGGLYLFKAPLEARLYAHLHDVPAASTAVLPAHVLVDRAVAAEPGRPARFVAPAAPGRTAEVGVATQDGVVAVFLDPADGRVVGHLADDARLMEVLKRIHSLAIAGAVANHWIEVVAGWAVVLVASGLFLWWPRGRSGGVTTVRGRPRQRVWWRDVHAVTGLVASGAIVFLAVTGMPWSAFWGAQFGRLTGEWGVGVPKHVWGPAPLSDAPALAGLRDVPWAVEHASPPESSPDHAGHAHDTAPAAATTATAVGDIGLDGALQRLAALGVPTGTPVRLPVGPRGAYTAMHFPDDVRDVRVVHLDRYSGRVLADIRHADYGVVGRATEWGIALHTGRQFGLVNQLVMLAGCGAIVALAVTSAVMWWKRRPRGKLAAPPRRAGDRAAVGALAVAALLGALYPLLGASMVAVALVDAAVPARWRARFGL